MLIIIILAISIVLQFSAAFFAFRLITVTGKTYSWIFISAALFLMGVRRLLPLFHLIFKSQGQMPDLMNEIIGMILSLFMFCGVVMIRPMFIDRKKMKERHLQLIDNMMEGYQVIGRDWRYLYINNTVARQGKKKKEELFGRTMMEAYPGIENTDLFIVLKNCMENRIPNHFENEFAYPDGSKGWFDLNIQPVPDGISILSIDMTDRKRAENEIQKLNEELEQKVIVRTAELASAMEKAKAADRLKSTFLATMSHELRTPLNSIIGFTGIILQGLVGALNDEQKKQLVMVQKSAQHLLSLINDVLDISKIEAGQLELSITSFQFKPSIEKLVKLISPLAEKKELALHLDIAEDMGTITSDQRRIEQIILNLLSNAVKFTDSGHIRISCGIENKMCFLSIADTGIGMPAEEIPNLFQPFHQIDGSTARKTEGTGLGLSICKKILDMLGGSIDVKSTGGEGSVFTIRFPQEADRYKTYLSVQTQTVNKNLLI